jgi:phage FluMu protein Com
MQTINAKLELKCTATCPRCKVDNLFDVKTSKDTELHAYLNKSLKTHYSCVICGAEFFVNKIETIRQFGE